MKRRLFHALSIAILLSLLTAALVPVAAAGEKATYRLIGGEFIEGKGVVFVFSVEGKHNPNNFNGHITLHGVAYNLVECNLRENGLLACVAEQGLSKHIGDIASANTNGDDSSGMIRSGTREYCYPVFDYDPQHTSIWGQFATHCQPSPAKVNDTIKMINPAFSATTYWTYIFMVNGHPICFRGDGFYYISCPPIN